MLSLETLRAFVYTAEAGSFSAAARKMGKAHSAVSTAIANLEIDCGLILFDRSSRNPVLTHEGETLLPHARGMLLGNREFLATASSMAKGVETQLSLSVEQGISMMPLHEALGGFSEKYPHVSLNVRRPSPSDSARLLRGGKTDIGLMAEQEGYPSGFQFRGIGYTKMIPVCAPGHPLAQLRQCSYRDMRQHRQILRHRNPPTGTPQQYEKKSLGVWHVEDPNVILELIQAGLAWAELPLTAAAKGIAKGKLVQLNYSFQQNDQLEGIDLVWTERRTLGIAGQWVRDQLLKLPQKIWQEG